MIKGSRSCDEKASKHAAARLEKGRKGKELGTRINYATLPGLDASGRSNSLAPLNLD